MEALSVSEYSVLGWCEGGTTAILMATMFPDAVKTLVTFSARSYITSEEMAAFEIMSDTSGWKQDSLIGSKLSRIYGSSLQEKWSTWMDSMNDCLSKNKGDMCTQQLPKVVCPTLIIHGAKDELTPAFHSVYLSNHVTGSRLKVMEDGKHVIHLRFTEEFNRLVRNF